MMAKSSEAVDSDDLRTVDKMERIAVGMPPDVRNTDPTIRPPYKLEASD